LIGIENMMMVGENMAAKERGAEAAAEVVRKDDETN
jgi:hypothetical protein